MDYQGLERGIEQINRILDLNFFVLILTQLIRALNLQRMFDISNFEMLLCHISYFSATLKRKILSQFFHLVLIELVFVIQLQFSYAVTQRTLNMFEGVVALCYQHHGVPQLPQTQSEFFDHYAVYSPTKIYTYVVCNGVLILMLFILYIRRSTFLNKTVQNVYI